MSDRRERIDDLPTVMQGMLEQFQSTLWTAMPARIVSITSMRDKIIVDCQPTLRCKFNNKDGGFEWVDMPVLADVPVVFPSGGGFMLAFPLKIDDEVLVVFANRCIDAWWQSGGVQNQIEFRTHDLSDGFALPGPFSQPRVPPQPLNSNNVQLRNMEGDTFVEITPSGTVRIKATESLEVQTPVVTIAATDHILLSAPTIQISGDVQQLGGDVSFAGGTLTHQGVNVGSTHKHSGVAPGSSNTGNPV